MRRLIVVGSSVLLGACLFASTFGFWYALNVVDEDRFTDHALTSFEREGSYDALGDLVARKVVAAYPSLALLGSSLSTLLGALLATEPFEPALDQIARDLHDRILANEDEPIVFDLADFEDALVGQLSVVSPDLVRLIPADAFREYTVLEADEIPRIRDETDRLRVVAIGAIVIGFLLVGTIVVSSASDHEALLSHGLAFTIAGLFSWLLTSTTRGTLSDVVDDEAYRTVLVNLYDTMAESLQALTVVLLVVGGALLVSGAALMVARTRSADSQGADDVVDS